MQSKKVPQKGSVCHHHKQKITETQKETLFFLTKEFLTTKQIAVRRQTSERAVRKIIEKLRKKGYINKENMVRNKKGMWYPQTEPFSNHSIRFHSLEFNVRILFKDHRYKAFLSKSNFFEFDGNTVRLFKNAIEVYVAQSFYGKTVDEARDNGFKYANWLFSRLESQLKIILVKDRVQNIRLVKQHFSEVNNELAKDFNVESKKLHIKGADGKTWLLVDNSFNLHELEAVHPELAEKDMGVVKGFFDSLRFNPVNLTEILGLIRENSAGIQAILRLSYPDVFKSDVVVKDKKVVKNILKPEYIG